MFNSTVLTLPGIGGSGPDHWQSLWEKEYHFIRIEQTDWNTPRCEDWVSNIQNELSVRDLQNVLLVGHSAACAAIAHWAKQYKIKLKGALLVAPADPDAKTFPPGTLGFAPMPSAKLPFPSILVASSNDHFATLERSKEFADAWGSKFINIGKAGHINPDSGHGQWDQGLEILKRLDSSV